MSTGRPQQVLQHVTPPANFAPVIPGVYRCAYPLEARQAHFLRSQLHIRVVCQLASESLSGPVVEALSSTHKPAPTTTTTTGSAVPAASPVSGSSLTSGDGAGSSPLSTSVRILCAAPSSVDAAWLDPWTTMRITVHTALDMLFDETYHPLVLCCPTGEVETSLVVGCLRTMQRWTLSSVLSEAELFLSLDRPEVTIRDDIRRYLEQFDFDPYRYRSELMSRRKALREIVRGGVGGRPNGGQLHGQRRHDVVAVRAGIVELLHHGVRQGPARVAGLSSATGAVSALGGGGVAAALPTAQSHLTLTPPGLGAESISPQLNASFAHIAELGDGSPMLPDATDPLFLPLVIPSATLLECIDMATKPFLLLPARLASSIVQGRPLPPALAPHEKYWWSASPPVLDSRSSFNRNESLVEEDDD